MNISIHKPVSLLSGKINLPGSKSISNRVLMIKALSGMNFRIQNLSDSDDTKYLQKALEQIRNSDAGIIDVGHAGTDMRFLSSFLSIQTGKFELTGSERMQQRPMEELVKVLNEIGAKITYKNKQGYPPLLIEGNNVNGGTATIKGNISSQFISSLLLVAPYFTSGLELILTGNVVSVPYIKMTITLMKEFGAKVDWVENRITVLSGKYSYDKDHYEVESDWSAASYYYSMVALSEMNATLEINTLFRNSLQADSVCAEIYKSFGVRTDFADNKIAITKVDTACNDLFEYDFVNCPDIAQTLACTCVGLNRSFYFKGLQTLKVKETDRIIALKNEFEKLGFKIMATDNSIRFENDLSERKSRVVATYNDHRMAMSFATLSMVINELIIENADVVSKSYPTFWKDLQSIGFIIKEK